MERNIEIGVEPPCTTGPATTTTTVTSGRADLTTTTTTTTQTLPCYQEANVRDVLHKRLINVADPIDQQDAATKCYVDGLLSHRAPSSPSNININTTSVVTTPQGHLNLQNRRIIQLHEPQHKNDAASKKYVDKKFKEAIEYVDHQIIDLRDVQLAAAAAAAPSRLTEDLSSQVTNLRDYIHQNATLRRTGPNEDYHFQNKRLTNVADAEDESDVVTLGVLRRFLNLY